MLGNLTLDFAITSHKGSTTSANIDRIAKEYTTPIQTYNKIPHNAMKLNPEDVQTPLTFSLLKESSSTAVLSVLKKAEKEDTLVLRFFNPTETEAKAAFSVNLSINQLQEGN